MNSDSSRPALMAELNKPTTSVEAAAEILGIGRSSYYAAIKNGELPALRIGRRIVVPTAPLRRLLGLEDGK